MKNTSMEDDEIEVKTSQKRELYIDALADLELGTKTDTDLSKILKVSVQSMCKYKKEPGFWDEVSRRRRENLKGKATHVWRAVYRDSLKGQWQQQKAILQTIGDYTEKAELQHTGKVEVSHTVNENDPLEVQKELHQFYGSALSQGSSN